MSIFKKPTSVPLKSYEIEDVDSIQKRFHRKSSRKTRSNNVQFWMSNAECSLLESTAAQLGISKSEVLRRLVHQLAFTPQIISEESEDKFLKLLNYPLDSDDSSSDNQAGNPFEKELTSILNQQVQGLNFDS